MFIIDIISNIHSVFRSSTDVSVSIHSIHSRGMDGQTDGLTDCSVPGPARFWVPLELFLTLKHTAYIIVLE